jgi:hypothetical protein
MKAQMLHPKLGFDPKVEQKLHQYDWTYVLIRCSYSYCFRLHCIHEFEIIEFTYHAVSKGEINETLYPGYNYSINRYCFAVCSAS